METALVPVNGGPPVSISTWRGVTESYDVTGHQGQAAMYFTIGQPGRYLLATRNATPSSIADVAVGRGIGRSILIPLVLILPGLFALVAGLVIGGVTVFRRRRARRHPGLYEPSGHTARSYLQGGSVGFGEATKLGLRNGFVYRGRASLSAYWWFILFLLIVLAVVVPLFIAITAATSANTGAANLLVLPLALVIGIMALYLNLVWLALVIRRLHDIDKSGWWVLINLVPFVGPIILLVFTLLAGTPGLNDYEPT
jgi:uncharacterized membrane protein YhaH (DUF805 family)